MRTQHFRILALGPNPWNGPWRNRQHLLSRLARQHSVLYSCGLWTIWERRTLAWREAPVLGRFEEKDGVTLDQPPKILQRWPRHRTWDTFMLRLGILRWQRRLEMMPTGPIIAYVFHPKFWPYVKLLNADFLVYQAYDLLNKMRGWDSVHKSRQENLVSSADLVLASSPTIANELKLAGAPEVKVLPNGADYGAFAQKTVEPTDLSPIPHPRVGYTGTINRKVDLRLVHELATAHPNWHFVFLGHVGDLDAHTNDALRECKQLTNCHFLGTRTKEQIPAYVQAMDVNIMCYRIDDQLWTEGIYPLKLHEYLASGRAVVSSDLPTIRPFENVVDIARNFKEWEEILSAAVSGHTHSTTEERRAIARQNSWEHRVEALNQYLHQMVVVSRSGHMLLRSSR